MESTDSIEIVTFVSNMENSNTKKGKNRSVSTHLSEEEIELLKKAAAEKEWSVSKIVRKAVRKYFGLD